MTDHYLLMTATPHKGDPKNFCLFLELLDKDVYGDVASLEMAMQRNSAPFYLRRTKEALVTFYAVFNCASTPEVHPIQDPARLGWQPIVTIEHYHVGAEVILTAENAEK